MREESNTGNNYCTALHGMARVDSKMRMAFDYLEDTVIRAPDRHVISRMAIPYLIFKKGYIIGKEEEVMMGGRE